MTSDWPNEVLGSCPGNRFVSWQVTLAAVEPSWFDLCRGRDRTQRADLPMRSKAVRRSSRTSRWVQVLVVFSRCRFPGAVRNQTGDERMRSHAMRQKQGESLRRAGALREDMENDEEAFDESDSLLPFAVTAGTAQQYLKAVSGLVDHLLFAQARFTTPQEKDRAIATYICHLARPEGEFIHPQRGQNLMAGVVFVCPDWAHRLPKSWRSLAAWRRNFIAGEGGPETCEMIWCLIAEMREAQREEEADALSLQHDCYLRAGELLLLRVTDVSSDGDDWVIRLGIKERKEKTKTGSHQGVRVDWPGTEAMLKKRTARRAPDEKLFSITSASYRQAWHEAGLALKKRIGIDSFVIGPPHSVRHSGPSRDSATGYRSIWQIQRRGRWQSEKSVMRYAKTWAWTTTKSRTPAAVLDRGSQLLKERGLRQPMAKE